MKYWYAVYVRSRYEKKVHKLFLDKGIESSLPLLNTTKQWSDRKKKVKVPLFRGYVFVWIDIHHDKLNVLQTNGVIKLIGIQNEPSRIPDEQIHWMNKLVQESVTIRHEKEIPIGHKMRISSGAFKGLEGIVIRARNQSRFVILVESIMHAVSIEIDPFCLEKIYN